MHDFNDTEGITEEIDYNNKGPKDRAQQKV